MPPMSVTESLLDAKDVARQAEVRTDIAGVRTDLAGSLLTILDGQRQAERSVFHQTMWLIATVITWLRLPQESSSLYWDNEKTP